MKQGFSIADLFKLKPGAFAQNHRGGGATRGGRAGQFAVPAGVAGMLGARQMQPPLSPGMYSGFAGPGGQPQMPPGLFSPVHVGAAAPGQLPFALPRMQGIGPAVGGPPPNGGPTGAPSQREIDQARKIQEAALQAAADNAGRGRSMK